MPSNLSPIVPKKTETAVSPKRVNGTIFFIYYTFCCTGAHWHCSSGCGFGFLKTTYLLIAHMPSTEEPQKASRCTPSDSGSTLKYDAARIKPRVVLVVVFFPHGELYVHTARFLFVTVSWGDQMPSFSRKPEGPFVHTDSSPCPPFCSETLSFFVVV